jgi:tetratricopeptide (TPR) repeat protein
LHIYKEVGYRQGISILFSYLSLLFYHLGDPKSAQDYGLRAHLLAQDLNDSLTQGFALTNSGHALTAIGRWVEAADHYRRAYEIRQKAQQYNLAMESLTGLAEVYLLQDELDSAQPYLAQILDYLKKNSLDA